MKTLRIKAWAHLTRDAEIAWECVPTRPRIYMTKEGAMVNRSIDNERIVRVLVTIASVTPAKRAAKRGRK